MTDLRGTYKRTKEICRKNSEALKGKYIGIENSNWKGGKISTGHGYVWIYKSEHPNANKDGYVLEHRLVMEDHLGRYLSPLEVVHHKNEIRSDNRIENLMLFANNAEHRRYHKKGKSK